MSCKFTIKPKIDIKATYQIALKEIKRLGAKYEGDSTGGKFKIEIFGMRFKGLIGVEGDIIMVEITDKPLLMPASLIKTSVKRYVKDLTQGVDKKALTHVS